MPVNLEIDVAERADWTVVTVSGEIDLASAPRVESRVAELMSSGVKLVVDLGSVTFIDSTGLRVLISSHREVESHGGSFAVIAGHGPVARLLDLTGVDQQMPIHDSVEAVTGP